MNVRGDRVESTTDACRLIKKLTCARQTQVDAGDEEESPSFSAAATEDDRCDDGGDAGVERRAEECLMRRTLVAHTDYIYTQGGNHN